MCKSKIPMNMNAKEKILSIRCKRIEHRAVDGGSGRVCNTLWTTFRFSLIGWIFGELADADISLKHTSDIRDHAKSTLTS